MTIFTYEYIEGDANMNPPAVTMSPSNDDGRRRSRQPIGGKDFLTAGLFDSRSNINSPVDRHLDIIHHVFMHYSLGLARDPAIFKLESNYIVIRLVLKFVIL